MNWNPVLDSQMAFTIAADTRLSQPNYTDDQIWELRCINTEPVSLGVQTTLGLRANWVRFFPIFTRRDVTLTDPASFYKPPVVMSYYPNYIAINFVPFNGIDVLTEYWVVESNLLAGRLRIANRSILTESFRFEWAGSLNPLGDGDNTSVVQVGVNQVLRGRVGKLFNVCVMSGNPQGNYSPFTSLAADVELFPGNFRLFNWAVVTQPDPDEAIKLAQTTIARAWDAEIARIEMQNASQLVEISTGIPEWDAAFDMAQKVAFSLVMPASEHLPDPSFVSNRNPDQGFSRVNDGTDYSHHWNGQTPLDSWYLASILMPGGVQTCKGLINNFLSVQQEDGFIDLKPGLARQRSRHLAQPLLATLALQIAQTLDDDSWLEKIYPGLFRFFEKWFQPEYDRDRDGIPEWSHPSQSGLADSPMVNIWQSDAQGVNISTLVSPALRAFLFRECQSLIKIGRRIRQEEKNPWLTEKGELLKKAIAQCWDENAKNYRYRDCLSCQSPDGKELLSFLGAGKFRVRRTFAGAQRLQLNLKFQDENSHPIRIKIIGQGENGELTEEASNRDIAWGHGQVFYTSLNLFTTVSRLEVHGLGETDRGILSTVDYNIQDISLLLPLWAGAMEEDEIKKLVEETILKKYLKPFGCLLYIKAQDDEADTGSGIHLLWNQLIGEGLIASGHRGSAAELVTRLMNAIAKNFQSSASFWDVFNAETSMAGGERNTLHGLAPLGLFLQTLGIQRLTPDLVILQDVNPFSFPITVKYRGIKITRHSSDTVITFPSGQTVTVKGEGTQQVTIS